MDPVGIGVEGRERAHRRHEHAHRVGVVAEALHEVLDVLVHERVDRDLVHPVGQLSLRRQRAVDDQVGDLEVGGVLAQLLDRVAAVLEYAGLPVDVGDRAAAGGGVRVGGVIGHQAEVLIVGLDLPEVHCPHGSILDRELVGLVPVRLSVTVSVSSGATAAPLPAIGSAEASPAVPRLGLGAHLLLLSTVCGSAPIMRHRLPLPAGRARARRGARCGVRAAGVAARAPGSVLSSVAGACARRPRARAAARPRAGHGAARAWVGAAGVSEGDGGGADARADRSRRPARARSQAARVPPIARAGTARRSGSSTRTSAR